MYGSPTIYLELAKARHNDVLATARRYQFPKDQIDELESSSTGPVRGFFAGIAGAVSGLTRPKPAHKPATDPC